jgi:hypothetical protein
VKPIRPPINATSPINLYGDSNGANHTPDTLTAVGSHPLDLVVGNNVNIEYGAQINVSAVGPAPGAGGGAAYASRRRSK